MWQPPPLPTLFSPAVPHQVSVLLQLLLARVKFSPVLLVIVNYKMVVTPEAAQSGEKEANEMCGKEWWREARREV